MSTLNKQDTLDAETLPSNTTAMTTVPSASENAADKADKAEATTLKEVVSGKGQTESAKETEVPGEIGSLLYAQLPPPFHYKTHLNFFENENEKFWDLYGKAIATKNLWISIGNLFLAFAIWLVWSIVGVLILESWTQSDGEYFHFSEWDEDMDATEYKTALWLIPATAGLSGATLRLTNSFMIAPAGSVCMDALNVLNVLNSEF